MKPFLRGVWIFNFVFLFLTGSVPAETQTTAIKIEEIQEDSDANSATEQVNLNEINERSQGVSKYGTVKAVQLPIEWMGKGIDGFVKGVAKVGSLVVSLPAKTAQAIKGKRGQDEKEKTKE